MKYYLLDTNIIISSTLLDFVRGSELIRYVYTIDEVINETNDDSFEDTLKDIGLKILKTGYSQINKLNYIFSSGFNLQTLNSIINLYHNNGNADVILLAHILVLEEKNQDELFKNEYILVSEDSELKDLAKHLKIKALSRKDFENEVELNKITKPSPPQSL